MIPIHITILLSLFAGVLIQLFIPDKLIVLFGHSINLLDITKSITVAFIFTIIKSSIDYSNTGKNKFQNVKQSPRDSELTKSS
jgi:hypothetical protein